MIDIDEFRELKPKFDYVTYQLEPFVNVSEKYKKMLPNFPECVLEQWTYRHFDDFCNKYWWIQYDRLVFNKVLFSREQIMSIGTAFLDTQDYWGDDFINNPEFRVKQTWLGGFMNENRTWLKPVIVFDVNNSIIDEEKELKYGKLIRPLHLLEGHMRLAYMRALIRYSISGVPDKHYVWLVKRQ